MKRGLVVSLVFIIVLCAAEAFAAQPLGGPAEADPGKTPLTAGISLSAGYFYSQDKWTSHTISGDFDPKIETNMYYGQLAYGLAPGWDVYLRAGGIDAKLVQSDVDFKSDGQFFASIGMHGRLFEKKDWHLAIGPVANFGYYSNWTDRASGVVNGAPGNLTFTMKDHYSFDVGLGLQWAPVPYLQLYGGPFYHYETAKLETTGTLGGFRFSDSNNIEPDKSFGTRLGVRIPLTKQVALQFEGQFRDYASGGGWISFSF